MQTETNEDRCEVRKDSEICRTPEEERVSILEVFEGAGREDNVMIVLL